MIIGEKNHDQCVTHHVDHDLWINMQERTRKKDMKSC